MSLKDDLAGLRAKDLGEPKAQAAYDAVVDQLSRAESAGLALKVGDAAPMFVLPNSEGHLVSSDELLKRGPLIVSFFRGSWCPYCRKTLEALESALPRIEAAGGQLVALTPDTGAHLASARRMHSSNYEVLSDVDGAVSLQFGTLIRVPKPYRELLTEFGIDLAERHGNAGWFIPMPATFVVDRAGLIRYTFVNVDYTHRAEPDDIVDILLRLKRDAS